MSGRRVPPADVAVETAHEAAERGLFGGRTTCGREGGGLVEGVRQDVGRR